MAEYQQTRPWLKPFRNERNRGSGFNTKRAISLATKDYLFWQTVDWAYDIRHLAAALPALGAVDVLQGVRVDTTSARGMVQQPFGQPVQGARLGRELPADSNAVPTADQRLPERHGVSAPSHSVRHARDRKLVYES